MSVVGLIYEYFAADDDRAARKILDDTWPSPTFRTEVFRPYELDLLEAQLTGGIAAEIAADARFNATVGLLIPDDDIVEGGVVTVTDSLVRALAGADDATLDAFGDRWFGEVPAFATIARHAREHERHLYCFWTQ